VPEGAVVATTPKNVTPEQIDEKIKWIKDAAGARFDDIELQTLTFFVQVTDDRESVINNLAGMFGLSPEEAAGTPLALVGTHNQIAETLIARRDRHGFTYIVVQEAALDDFAPVVEKLAGS
ncbi:MAG: hypothetical protein QOI95_2486, partial [Acidimicrobiaceae bacterium]